MNTKGLQNATDRLGTDKILKLILRMGVPAMLAQFVNVLYSIVDRIFISNIAGIGDAALAGVGVAIPVLTLVAAFSSLIGLGGAPLFAMKLGSREPEKARQILANCLVMLLFFSVLLMAVAIPFQRQLLLLFGASENTVLYAEQYFGIYILGTAFVVVGMGLNFFITAQGYAKVSMFTVLIGAALNILLDPLFIFVFKMHVAGAALATIIAQAASCAFVLIFLISKRTPIKLGFKGVSVKIMLKIVKLGLSPFLIIATDSLVIILLNSILQRYGGAAEGDLYVTAATIVLSFMQVATLPLGGITAGCQPILSYNYGAGNAARVKETFWKLNIVCVCFTTVMFIVAMSVPELFARIFSSDPAVLSLSAKSMRVFTAGLIFLAVQYACVDSLTALGQAGIAITLSMLRKLVVMTALLFTLPAFLGAGGAFLAEPIADVVGCFVSGTVCIIMLKKILSKNKKPAII